MTGQRDQRDPRQIHAAAARELRRLDDTAVDIPPVRFNPEPALPVLRPADGASVRAMVEELWPVEDQPRAIARAGELKGPRPGELGSPYPGRAVWMLGERVWCWYGPLTDRWWGLVPWESRVGGPRQDCLVEARTPGMLRREICRVLQGALR